MDDFSRLGAREIATGNSTLISSSRYLNDPRLRDAMATAILRRNGRERRVGWDSTPIVRAYRELRDAGPHRAGTRHADCLRWCGHEGGESNDFAALYIEWVYGAAENECESRRRARPGA